MAIEFGTKAETLERVSQSLRNGQVLPLFYFSRSEWDVSRKTILSSLTSQPWAGELLIVRSSAVIEDQAEASLAGKYDSVPNVSPIDGIERAVRQVFDSFEELNPGDQVLVQPMLRKPCVSGVACSVDPSTGAPYRVISYARGEGTDHVTAGKKAETTTWYSVSHRREDMPSNGILRMVTCLVDEIEELVAGVPFEIEFALSEEQSVVLLQLRRLAAHRLNLRHHIRVLKNVEARLHDCSARDPRILGSEPLLGVMPDWNPAEMIGVRPLPLARSLYERLITDGTWAEQRRACGYRDLRGVSLMVDIGGHAFIDVRASFTSMVPADVPDAMASRLVNAYSQKLKDAPHLHDKIEFEIVLSCLAFDTASRAQTYTKYGLLRGDHSPLLKSLSRLTEGIIVNAVGGRQKRAVNASLRKSSAISAKTERPLDTVCVLLDRACLGTQIFARLARSSFIAHEILDSAVRTGLVTREERNAFLLSLDTVASRMRRDFVERDRSEFLEYYGHLRPGTYDIRSPRYDEAPDRYFDWSGVKASPAPVIPFIPTKSLAARLDEGLRAVGLSLDHKDFLAFAKNAIRGRDDAKFEFTRYVSSALAHLQEWGLRIGLTNDDLAFVDVDTLVDCRNASDRNIRDIILRVAERARKSHEESRAINLPSLICGQNDVWHFQLVNEQANFITNKQTTGRVALIEKGDSPEGAIAFIASADPGFDWIFGRGIRGLVTAYGGVNSHMAIRCLEFGIPAVIGCGEQKFRRLSEERWIEIDGETGTIQSVPQIA